MKYKFVYDCITLYIFIFYFIYGVIFRRIWLFINTAVTNPNFAYPLDCYTLYIYKLSVFGNLVNGVNCKASQEEKLLP